MAYLSHTEAERKEMLKFIGVNSIDDLFADIPSSIKAEKNLGMTKPHDEMQVRAALMKLAKKNSDTTDFSCFLGAGYYDHFIPAMVPAIVSREEFLTAYTPYQAEISQGFLQAIFEYQSMICSLTGMEVSNASMYDGATAVVEASVMAVNFLRKKQKIIILGSVNPEIRKVTTTYFKMMEIPFEFVETTGDTIDLAQLKSALTDDVAGVVVQYPNFFGTLEDMSAISALTHEIGALLIVSTYPIALGLLKSPSDFGADIVVGEGQSLGNELAFGGPTFGFLATTMNLVRMMPGRIVGESIDSDGNRAFTLTLQAREQHIKRHRALSNICSNQSLCMLKAAVYMSYVGPNGLETIANNCYEKAHYLADKIQEIPGFSLWNTGEFFNEFLIETPCSVDEILEKFLANGILAGIKVSDNKLLIAVTEKRSDDELEAFITVLKECV